MRSPYTRIQCSCETSCCKAFLRNETRKERVRPACLSLWDMLLLQQQASSLGLGFEWFDQVVVITGHISIADAAADFVPGLLALAQVLSGSCVEQNRHLGTWQGLKHCKCSDGVHVFKATEPTAHPTQVLETLCLKSLYPLLATGCSSFFEEGMRRRNSSH